MILSKQKFFTGGFKLLFSVLILLFFGFGAKGQSDIFCGRPPVHTATSTNPDSIFYDIWGNSYDLSEGQKNANETEVVENYFTLRISNDIDPELRTTIEEAFRYISDHIIRRSLTCDEVTPPNIFIKIKVDNTIPTLANSSPIMENTFTDDNCRALALSRVYVKVNGGLRIHDAGNDGIIRLKTANNWCPYDRTPTSTENDLFSVILHEMGHLLGFASAIEADPVPDSGTPTGFQNGRADELLIWDKYLSELNGDLIFEAGNNCSNNCWTVQDSWQNFLDMMGNNCSQNSQNSIAFAYYDNGNSGSVSYAPLAGLPSYTDNNGTPIFPGAFRNYTSHLCDDPNEDYLMRTVILPGTTCREFTDTELKILATLGYHVILGDNTTHLDGNYVVPVKDYPFYYQNDENIPCCSNYFYACAGETITVTADNLLCNDSHSANATVSNVWIDNPNFNGSITDNNGSWDIFVPEGENHDYRLAYSIKSESGNDCKIANSYALLLFDECPSCDIPAGDTEHCDNLFCLEWGGNTHNIHSSSYLQLGVPFMYDGTDNNSPDWKPSDPNFPNHPYIYMFAQYDRTSMEAIALTLQAPIEPGCSIELSFEAKGTILDIFASENPPCNVTDTYVNYGNGNGCGVSTNCQGYTYVPHCITNQSPFSLPSNSDFMPVTIQWTNSTNDPINYIIIGPSPGSDVLISDLTLTKTCLSSIDFEIQDDCSRNFTFTPTGVGANHGNYTYNWNFGDGNSTNVPTTVNHHYDTDGDYTVTLTLSNDCETIEQSHTITVTSIDATFTQTTDNCDVTFTSTDEGSHSWDFGDGSTSTEVNPTHSYFHNGTYTVTHTVTVGDCEATETAEIVITGCSVSSCEDDTYTIWYNQSASNVGSSAPANVLIIGTFTIDIPSFAFNHSNVIMEEGAEIIVKTGNRLRILNSTLQGCEYMWKGIRSEVAAIIDVQYSHIADAQYAITVAHKTELQMSGNEFYKNYVGLYAPPGTTSFSYYPKPNKFYCTNATLLPKYANQVPVPGSMSYAGMLLYDIDDISTPYNTFEYLRNGIIAYNTTLRVESNKFDNMESDNEYNLSGYGIRAIKSRVSVTGGGVHTNYFENCATGIYARQSDVYVKENSFTDVNIGVKVLLGMYKKITIEDNTISGSKYGIYLIHNDNAKILHVNNNTIDLSNHGRGICVWDAGIGIFDASINNNAITVQDNGIGIAISSALYYKIKNNPISLVGNATDKIIGIKMKGLVKSSVQGNTVTGYAPNGTGIYSLVSGRLHLVENTVANISTGFKFSGASTGTTFARNIMDQNQTGLHMTGSAFFGDPDNENIQEHNCNVWTTTGDLSLNKARHDGDDNNIYFSKFIIHEEDSPTNNSEFWPNIIYKPNSTEQWFFEQPDPNNTCIDDDPLTDDPGEKIITDFDKQLAKDELEFLEYSEEQKWQAKRFLYQKLKENPELIGEDVDVDSFYYAEAGKPIGEFYDIKVAKEEMLTVEEAIKILLNQKEDQINAISQNLKLLEAQLPENPTEDEMNQFFVEQQILLDELHIVEVERKAIINDVETQRDADADDTKNDNGFISTSEMYEANEKVVNDIYLSTAAKSNNDFSTSQIDELLVIASQCPLEGGTAVFKARGLLALAEIDNDYDDELICIANGTPLRLGSTKNEEENGGDKGILENSFKIYPNPVSEVLNIEYKIAENAEIEIYNLLGKECYFGILNSENDLIEIDLSEFSNGAYFYSIIIKGQRVKLGSFVLLK